MIKKKCAVFTIVRNENIFLPIWYKYYSQFFHEKDIYVIDDSSNDGSTNFIPELQKKIVFNEFAYSHEYLRNTVNSYRKELLENYEYVIFAEADEILLHTKYKLNDYINSLIDNKINHVTANGWEIYHDYKHEKSIDLNRNILEQRKYWFKYPLYDKTLISNMNIEYGLGFHDIINLENNKYEYLDENLYLLHLHRFDYNLHNQRKLKFIKINKHNDDPGLGVQNKLQSKKEIINFYKSVENLIEEIPNNIKQLNSF